MASDKLTGSCLCGTVKFEVSPPLTGFRYLPLLALQESLRQRARGKHLPSEEPVRLGRR